MKRETKLPDNAGRKETVPAKGCNLGDLLKQITGDSIHEAVDFGPPQGKEAC